MSKNINVDSHVKRYLVTELSDLVRLHKALGDLIEQRKGSAIAEYEEKLALLKNGEVPDEPKVVTPRAAKKTRGGKPVAEVDQQEL